MASGDPFSIVIQNIRQLMMHESHHQLHQSLATVVNQRTLLVGHALQSGGADRRPIASACFELAEADRHRRDRAQYGYWDTRHDGQYTSHRPQRRSDEYLKRERNHE
jgi:hypothetical protein